VAPAALSRSPSTQPGAVRPVPSALPPVPPSASSSLDAALGLGTPRDGHIALAFAALVLPVAVLDLFTFNFNFAIVYVLPLLIVSLTRSATRIWAAAAVLAVLAYAGYFFGLRASDVRGWGDMVNYRLTNRTLAVVGVLGSAALFNVELTLAAALRRRRDGRVSDEASDEASDENDRLFDEVMLSLDRFATLAICVLLTATIAGTDALTPMNYNLPILFSLPLVFTARTGSLRLLWQTLAVLLALMAALTFVGPPPAVPAMSVNLTANRLIGGVAMVGVAVILHLWIVFSRGHVTPPPQRIG
jgi:hypothetical protein